ncbi:MAG: tRNA pseudouridine(38-40) synthase TruA [Candidatus Omnitrophota bacterium]|nr:tRNA pseudouridine(38-40) synthase TruA [Candidatus Omnitrophota bacterium]
MPDKLSLRNIRLIVEYDGSAYHGWQSQKNTRQTIQEIIEKVLKGILQEEVSLFGSGRTDQGVHALAQVANFKTKSKISLSRLKLGLNSLLPKDIVITGIKEVPFDFHSQRSAKSKLYRYTILNRKFPSAFHYKYAWLYHIPLNLDLMKKEAIRLVGRHDFKSFKATRKDRKSTVRTIYELKIRKSGDFIYINIRGNGFVYNMVRSIVGTLVGIGSGKLSNIRRILLAKDRKGAGVTAPASGLCLMKVEY